MANSPSQSVPKPGHAAAHPGKQLPPRSQPYANPQQGQKYSPLLRYEKQFFHGPYFSARRSRLPRRFPPLPS